MQTANDTDFDSLNPVTPPVVRSTTTHNTRSNMLENGESKKASFTPQRASESLAAESVVPDSGESITHGSAAGDLDFPPPYTPDGF